MLVVSFPPIITANSSLLILGSMPGAMSLRRQQYYAHPRNHFWPIMEDLTGVPAGAEYPQRVERLADTGIALWDSLMACVRPGSLDASIVAETEEPNDFLALLSAHPAIRAICFNGKKSEQVFRKRVLPDLPATVSQRLAFHSLPSTSPANAGFTYEQKLARWRVILEYLPGTPSDGGC
ncbi:MAG: DNA-deoxyinosine glycosylase [Candidatus Promineofilum sp.]|nr:DNA-deoxyinosine glycosylase [Promineifilum sp.]